MASDEQIQATSSTHPDIFFYNNNLILPLRLESIMKLEGKDFVCAWLDCVKCHYVLSQFGERPTTLSLSSLAFDPSAGRINILIDWDAATVTHEEGDRTGAPAFLAMDMLGKARVPRLYRHDLEAFIWILPWVFLQFQDRRRISRVLSSWDSADYSAVHVQKSGILFGGASELHLEKTSPFLQEWPLAKRLVSWLFCEHVRRMTAAMFQPLVNDERNSTQDALAFPAYIKARVPAPKAPEPEKKAKQVYIDFWNKIVEVIRDYPQELDYVYDCIPRSV